jgi:hypothetical protein
VVDYSTEHQAMKQSAGYGLCVHALDRRFIARVRERSASIGIANPRAARIDQRRVLIGE